MTCEFAGQLSWHIACKDDGGQILWRRHSAWGEQTVGLLDMPGDADADLTSRQLDDLFTAFQRADVVLLIMDATRPARDPDLKLLDVMASRLKPYGIQEWLITALCEFLEEDRARALVRSLHAEANRERVRELLSQFHNAGRTLIKLFAKSSAKSTKRKRKQSR